jgi:hypothetical protein
MQLIKNKAGAYILGALGLMILILIVSRQSDLRRMEKDGVYVVGYVAKASKASNGVHYTCYYKYNKISYPAKFTAIMYQKEGDLVFFRISTSKPTAWKSLDMLVPSCIKLQAAPDTGWKQLPKCR